MIRFRPEIPSTLHGAFLRGSTAHPRDHIRPVVLHLPENS
jgi:hypothetical protein